MRRSGGCWPTPRATRSTSAPRWAATERVHSSRRCGSQATARSTQGRAKVPLSASPCPARSEPPTKEGHVEGINERPGWRRWGGKAALAAGGLLVGGVLAGTLTANAANNNGTVNQNTTYGAANGAYGTPAGPGHGGHVREI